MRAKLTSTVWIESATTLVAAVLMTLAGLATLHDGVETPTVSVSAPVRVTDAVYPADTLPSVTMPHVESSRG
jgi:hypothetical protein